MMAMGDGTAALEEFWAAARLRVASLPHDLPRDIWCFGDSPELADSLAKLVLSGQKRATTGLLAEMEAEGLPLPKVGGLSLVTDFHGAPLMVLRSTRVETLPFCKVDAAFAAVEGEGDGSLAYWQDAHERFFRRSCQRLGLVWQPDMLVVCECFELLYPVPG